MRCAMFATVFALTGAAVATAADPQPAQPAPPPTPTGAARIAQLEEDLELAEAARDVKRAYVMAAQVRMRGAASVSERLNGAANSGAGTKEDAERAKLDLEVAKAMVQIREAELKEAEVKVKHAKKRLDNAKATGGRPAPSSPPVPADPFSPARR